MTNEEYLLFRLTYKIDEFGNKDHQCVAFVKDHARQVYGTPLRSFNGFAKKATYRSGGTYDPDSRISIKPGTGVLQRGDHIIQGFLSTGHVGRVWRADDNGYYLVEQNNGELDNRTRRKRGNGDGTGNDAILVRYYGRETRPILFIFRNKLAG